MLHLLDILTSGCAATWFKVFWVEGFEQLGVERLRELGGRV